VVVVSGGLFRHSIMKLLVHAPTVEEFYAQNPGLKPPPGRFAEKAPDRKGTELLDHDYHLIPGTRFSVQFERSLGAEEKKKSIFTNISKGKVTIHGIEIEPNLITAIFSFEFSQVVLEKMGDSFKMGLGLPAAKPIPALKAVIEKRPKELRSSVLVQFDPAGVLKSAKIMDVPKAVLEGPLAAGYLELEIIESILRKLPTSTSGVGVVTERNDQGELAEIQYSIENQGDLRAFHSAQKTDSRETKGLDPRFARLSLQIKSLQDYDIHWRIKEGVPADQKYNANVDVVFQETKVATMKTGLTSKWGEGEKTELKPEDAKLFTFDLDLGTMRSKRSSNLKVLTKKGGKGKNGRDANSVLTWEDARAMLPSVNNPEMNEDERTRIFLGYSDALKRDPSLIKKIKEDLARAAPGSREMSMIMGTLGFAGTPEAQAALVEAFGRKDLKQEDREKVLSELAIPVEPLTPETKDFLKSTYRGNSDQDLSKMASFALGSSIAKDGDPSTISMFKKDWQDSYGLIGDGDKQEENKRSLLLAMGNSKSNAFLAEVKEGTQSSNVELRDAAVSAVRFNSDEPGRKILFDSLKSEPESSVRTTAARSLSYQPFDASTMMAAVKCATDDAAISVRMECYHYLADNVAAPEVRKFLEGRLGAEKDGRIIQIIEAALKVTDQK